MLYNNGSYYLGTDWYAYWSGIWSYSNGGGTGQPSSDQTPNNPQDQALWFAELGLVDPADATYKWGGYAHDQFMYQAVMSLMPLNTMYSGGSSSFRNNQNVTGMTGNVGSDSNPSWTLTPDLLMADTNGSGKWAMDGSGATMTATLTSGTMNLPTITAAGSGYTPSTVLYWFAPVGSSGCASIGSYGNAQAFNSGDNGTHMAAMGVVQTNSSGGVAGTVTVLSNATGCTSPPVITVKADKQLIRDYFYVIGQMMSYQNCCGYAPTPGTRNSSAVYDTSSTSAFGNVRTMGNNYTHSHIMFLIAVALTFDDNTTDDPALPNTCSANRDQVCADGTAGSLHAYWTYLTGSMFYLDWMHIEDPAVAQAAYTAAYGALGSTVCNDNVTSGATVARVPCFGDGRNGESSEGNWYQESMYREMQACASINSAGYLNPVTYGPQMSLCSSSWWDQKMNYDLSVLSYTYSLFGSNVYEFVSTGDTLNLFRTPSDFTTAAWAMVFDAATGRTDRTSKELGPLLYSPVGGISDFYNNLHNDYASANAWPMFVALPSGDPTSSPPSDPRTSLPLDTYSGNNQHSTVRDSWVSGGPASGTGTQQVFDVQCQNTRIDHEHGTCGSYNVLSDGEYITKNRMVPETYDYYLESAEHANELGLGTDQTQSACTALGGCYQGPLANGTQFWQAQIYVHGSIAANGSNYWLCTGTPCASTDVPGTAGDWSTTTATKGGGQMFHGEQAGTFTAYHSEVPDHVGYRVDDTYAYSASQSGAWPTIIGPTAASRSLVYLRGSKLVFVYDRGATPYAIRDWLTTTGAITITGNTTKWTTRSGNQDAFYTMLAPTSGVTISDAGAYLTVENGDSGNSDWEPYSHVLQDDGTPGSAQFLNVLQWVAHGTSKTATSLINSTSGQTFDGALVGTTAVWFMRSPATFTGTTFPASAATTVYLSDLTPETSYTISGTGAPASGTSDQAGVLTFSATGTGSITVGAGSSTPPPVTMTGTLKLSGTVSTK